MVLIDLWRLLHTPVVVAVNTKFCDSFDRRDGSVAEALPHMVLWTSLRGEEGKS